MTSDHDARPTSPATVDRVCALFSAALDVSGIAAGTDFFLAGGDSLSALAVAVSLEESFGTRVRVRDVIECATPERLAERFGAQWGDAGPGPERPAGDGAVQPPPGGEPVGAASRWLWLERQRSTSASAVYTVACLLHGDGELNVAVFAAAVDALPRRHPVLRRVFTETRGMVWSVPAPPARLLDVVDLAREHLSDEQFRAVVGERATVAFDPQAGPLFAMTLYLQAAGAWSVLIVADHLVCDGRSMEIIARDLVGLYRDPSAAAPREPLRREPPPDASLAYWRQVLSPPPEPLPLPVSQPRTGPAGVASDIAEIDIATGVLDQLRAMARATRVGVLAPLAAAVVLALAELTGSPDICVGTPVDRRSRAGTDGVVGFEVATVPLRLAVPANPEPAGLMREVAARLVDAVDHSDASFAEIVAAVDPPRPAWRTPVFDAWVALYPYIDTGPARPNGISLRGGPVPPPQGMFELSFQFSEHAAGIRLVLQYDEDRYEPGTARRIARRVAAAAARIADQRPAEPACEDGSARQGSGKAFDGFRFE